MANEARFNAAGWSQKDLAQNPNAPYGLPVVSYTSIGTAGVEGLGVGSFNGFDQWTYAGKDVLTKIHGAHTLKMGGEFTRLLFVDAPYWADRPSYNFNNMWDFLNDAPSSENAQFDPPHRRAFRAAQGFAPKPDGAVRPGQLQGEAEPDSDPGHEVGVLWWHQRKTRPVGQRGAGQRRPTSLPASKMSVNSGRRLH